MIKKYFYNKILLLLKDDIISCYKEKESNRIMIEKREKEDISKLNERLIKQHKKTLDWFYLENQNLYMKIKYIESIIKRIK